jgi:hypothetical protein
MLNTLKSSPDNLSSQRPAQTTSLIILDCTTHDLRTAHQIQMVPETIQTNQTGQPRRSHNYFKTKPTAPELGWRQSCESCLGNSSTTTRKHGSSENTFTTLPCDRHCLREPYCSNVPRLRSRACAALRRGWTHSGVNHLCYQAAGAQSH